MAKTQEELMEELERLESERQALREMLLPKVCPECGKRYSSWTQFCSQDGTELPEVQKCQRCGVEISDSDDGFCRRCGWDLSKPFEAEEKEEKTFSEWFRGLLRLLGA